MPRKKKLAKRFREKFFSVLRHPLVRDVLVIILIVSVLYFGIKGAMILFLQTEMPMMAVASNSMKHYNESWRDYYEAENYNPSDFPIQGGFERGDLLIIRGVNSLGDVSVGDIIVYDVGSGQRPIVHRVAEIVDSGGQVYFITMGDANYPNLDQWQVEPDDVLGEVVFVIPKLGYLSLWAGS
jgi:signal peptidase I